MSNPFPDFGVRTSLSVDDVSTQLMLRMPVYPALPLAVPPAGHQIYVTDDDTVYVSDGLSWVAQTPDSPVETAAPITGDGSALSPVTLSPGTAVDDVLQWDGADWNPVQLAGGGALIEAASGVGSPSITFPGNQQSVALSNSLVITQNMSSAVLFFHCYVQTPVVLVSNAGFFLQFRFTLNGANLPTLVYNLYPIGNPYPNPAAQTRTIMFYYPQLAGLSIGDVVGVTARINSNLVGWTFTVSYPFTINIVNGYLTAIGSP